MSKIKNKDDLTINDFECSFREIPELFFNKTPDKFKSGRYHGSCFWEHSGFGKTRFFVAAYIDFNYKPFLKIGLSQEEIVKKCVEYLNLKPPRKRKPLFGALECHQYEFKKDEKGYFIVVLLSTDEHNSKHFWGQGIRI